MAKRLRLVHGKAGSARVVLEGLAAEIGRLRVMVAELPDRPSTADRPLGADPVAGDVAGRGAALTRRRDIGRSLALAGPGGGVARGSAEPRGDPARREVAAVRDPGPDTPPGDADGPRPPRHPA